MFGSIITLVIIVTALIFYFSNRSRGKKIYNNYYKEKRKEFPWLNNWIKEKGINPAKIRLNEDEGFKIVGSIILLLLISLLGGWILNMAVKFVVWVFSPLSKPSSFFYKYTGNIIACIVAVIVAKFKFEKPLIQPDGGHRLDGYIGKTLECPSCHCPHSWVETSGQNIVEKEYTETVTTKKTTSWSGGSADDYGGGFIGALFAGAGSGSSSSTSTDTIKVFEGKAIKYYKCLNCDHTASNTKDKKWYTNQPDAEFEWKSPVASWYIPSPSERFFKSFANKATIIVLIIIAYISFGNIMNQLNVPGIADLIAKNTISVPAYDYTTDYEGDLVGGVPHGKGKISFPNGTVYEGDIVNGVPNGKGKFIYPNETIYEGDVVNGRHHGKGKSTSKDGSYYEGDWEYGDWHGRGKWVPSSGKVEDGRWKRGDFIGK